MKTLQNNFTTPEQSKRLLKLGVPVDSADMYTPKDCTPYIFVQGNTYSKALKDWGLNICDNRVTPCWSVGRLNEIFKICSYNHIEIYDLDLEGTQIERAMQAFENYAKYNWLDFSKLEDYE